jgi:hypothetical protein
VFPNDHSGVRCAGLYEQGTQGESMQKPTIGLVAFWKGYDRKQTLRAAQLAD